MKITRIQLALVFAISSLTSLNAAAAAPLPAGECAAQVTTLLTTPRYVALYNLLQPESSILKTKLDAVSDQATYQSLLTFTRNFVNSVPPTVPATTARLVITLPDGTVVVDTGKKDDPANALPQGNSFNHFKSKTVNENHNSRIAILDSQLHVCGAGVESKFSTTDNKRESYVAIRLGNYLDNSGTARFSRK